MKFYFEEKNPQGKTNFSYSNVLTEILIILFASNIFSARNKFVKLCHR